MSEVDRVMQQTGMERMQAINHVRGRDILRLRTQSPLRSAASQSDAAHLPLFVTANEPTLF
jgi:hypothetical protein